MKKDLTQDKLITYYIFFVLEWTNVNKLCSWRRAKNTDELKDPTASCFAAIVNEFVANIHGSRFHVCFKNTLQHAILNNQFFENRSDTFHLIYPDKTNVILNFSTRVFVLLALHWFTQYIARHYNLSAPFLLWYRLPNITVPGISITSLLFGPRKNIKRLANHSAY